MSTEKKPRKSYSRKARGLPDRRLAVCTGCGEHLGRKNLYRVHGYPRLCKKCAQPMLDAWKEMQNEVLQ